jgi:hypothetical protein
MADYRGRRIALLTRHGKECVIGPEFVAPLGAALVHTEAYDTDLLGSFTGEIPRAGTQLEAARRKAEIGMSLTGLTLGLASEGSFGPSPFGFGTWNVEVLLFLDRDRGLEVAGVAQGPAVDRTLRTGDWAALEAFASSVGFPAQGLVLRRNDGALVKGLGDPAALRAAFDAARADGEVTIETDLRAFANPPRMQRIAEAARDLAARLASDCPACGAPGFGPHRVESGLPCLACGAPTTAPAAHIARCVRCSVERKIPVTSGGADPRWCPQCNP